MAERELKVLGPGMPYFVHVTPIYDHDLFAPSADPPTSGPRAAECRSPRGQRLCSCGMYALRWADA